MSNSRASDEPGAFPAVAYAQRDWTYLLVVDNFSSGFLLWHEHCDAGENRVGLVWEGETILSRGRFQRG